MSQTLPTDSKERKETPLVRGCLDYFPAALAAVARLSKAGNDKHNPGEEMHHARGKSNDHADCIARHLVDRGTIDPDDGHRHSTKVAWRALALLQEELEREEGAPLARGAREPKNPGVDMNEYRPLPPPPLTPGQLRYLNSAITGIHCDIEEAEAEAASRMRGTSYDNIVVDDLDPPLTFVDDMRRDHGIPVPVVHSIETQEEADLRALNWQEAPNNIHERIAGDTRTARRIKNQYYGGTEYMPGTPVVCDDGWAGTVVSIDVGHYGENHHAVEVRWSWHPDGRACYEPFKTIVSNRRLEVL